MKQAYLFVANWKMYLSPAKEESFYTENLTELTNLQKETGSTIVLCPSFLSTQRAASHLSETSIAVGAQTCSTSKNGAFTGQISSESLKKIGVKYCIVGHSERRRYNHESNSDVAKQVSQLSKHGIIPIICIGETKEERDQGKTSTVLDQQLSPILEISKKSSSLVIAYEPVWAIGTGITPSLQELSHTIDWLHAHLKDSLPETFCYIIYGGSVTDSTIKQFITVKELGGFFIGKASVDFQALKKVVRSWYTSL